jgi:hypothetical protein
VLDPQFGITVVIRGRRAVEFRFVKLSDAVLVATLVICFDLAFIVGIN